MKHKNHWQSLDLTKLIDFEVLSNYYDFESYKKILRVPQKEAIQIEDLCKPIFQDTYFAVESILRFEEEDKSVFVAGRKDLLNDLELSDRIFLITANKNRKVTDFSYFSVDLFRYNNRGIIKPFEEYTQPLDESAQDAIIHRLRIMNGLAQAIWNEPLYSGAMSNKKIIRVWKNLVEQGSAEENHSGDPIKSEKYRIINKF